MIHGRGASDNPRNRFEKIEVVLDEESAPETEFLRDASKSAIAYNESPDVGFEASFNPYRGCEHGCAYCYARPFHEYLGFSAGLDFETRILVKENAPALLRAELASLKWKPQVVAVSGVTDAYQPVERKLGLTRKCLEVFAEFRNPVAIITKNHLVSRDADVLLELARHCAASVTLSITTLDPKLANQMEPRASTPALRLEAISKLAAAGIPVGVNVAPVVPGLTDHEVPSILEAAAKAGARHAGYILLRLPFGVKEIFERWIEARFPDRKGKVMNRILETRAGALNDPRFHSRMQGEGIFAEQVAQLFALGLRRSGIPEEHPPLSTDAFRRPPGPQLTLF